MDYDIPKKIHIFENSDKLQFKEFPDKNNIVNFICPFRCVLLGPPSVGKTSITKNIIVQQKPIFNRIIVYHIDPSRTSEYDDIDCEMVSSLPDKDDIDPQIKTLLICEDIPFRDLKKNEKTNLDSFLRYVSSHKGVSIIMTAQDAFNIPPTFRRMANILCLWKSFDMNPIYTLCRFMGFDKKLIELIFDKLMDNKYDFITIDKSDSGPELRKNLFEPIIFKTEN